MRNMLYFGPVFEKRAPGVYHNTTVVIDADGTIKGLYRKMHIPDDPGYYVTVPEGATFRWTKLDWSSGNVITPPTSIAGVAEQPKYIIEYLSRSVGK